MTLKKLSLILALFAVVVPLYAQVEETIENGPMQSAGRGRFSDRLIIGGDLGLSFGGVTYIKLAPELDCRIAKRLTAGLGPIYIYENYRAYHLETSTYGGKAVVTFTILKVSANNNNLGLGDLVFHIENELVSVEKLLYFQPRDIYYFDDRIWIDNLLAGPGFIQSMSEHMSGGIYIMWDLTQNKYSANVNPVFKFAFYYSFGRNE
jgi:hypothetical protein